MNAYIMGKVDPGTEPNVRRKTMELGGVRKASIVYGDFDLVLEVEVKDLIELRELNENVRRIEGVSKTTTYIVRKEPRLHATLSR